MDFFGSKVWKCVRVCVCACVRVRWREVWGGERQRKGFQEGECPASSKIMGQPERKSFH